MIFNGLIKKGVSYYTTKIFQYFYSWISAELVSFVILCFLLNEFKNIQKRENIAFTRIPSGPRHQNLQNSCPGGTLLASLHFLTPLTHKEFEKEQKIFSSSSALISSDMSSVSLCSLVSLSLSDLPTLCHEIKGPRQLCPQEVCSHSALPTTRQATLFLGWSIRKPATVSNLNHGLRAGPVVRWLSLCTLLLRPMVHRFRAQA